MPGKKPKGEYAIQTVTNALRVLDAFRDADDFGVTELASRLHLHKNNVFRVVQIFSTRIVNKILTTRNTPAIEEHQSSSTATLNLQQSRSRSATEERFFRTLVF